MALTYQEVMEVTAALEPYIELENDSHSEAIHTAIHLSQYPDYISDELWEALCAYLIDRKEHYETNCEIIIVHHQYTRQDKELKWKNE